MTILAVCGPIGSDFKEFSEQCHSLLNKERTLLIDCSAYDSTASLLMTIEKLLSLREPECDIIIFGTDIFLDANLRAKFDIKVFLELDSELSLISHLKTSAINEVNIDELLTCYEKKIKPLNEEIWLSARHADLRRPQPSVNNKLPDLNDKLINLLIDKKNGTLIPISAPSGSFSRGTLWQSPASQEISNNEETTSLEVANQKL